MIIILDIYLYLLFLIINGVTENIFSLNGKDANFILFVKFYG